MSFHVILRPSTFCLTQFGLAALIEGHMSKARSTSLRNIAGPRIRAARLRLQPPLSQIALVKQINTFGFKFDPSVLCRIEIQERGVTDVELRTIAKCLKTTIAWLCGERGARS
jgi:hypothetical protein